MSVATARFYRFRGSLSSGEYPLFNTGQDLSPYMVHSVSVKYAKGLQTSIVVPEFTGYDSVNVVELDGSYYWVTAWKEATTLNGTVSMTLDYMGPTSLLRRYSGLTGVFHKTPYNVCPYLKQSITNGNMYIFDSYKVSALEIGEVVHDAGNLHETGYWVQVSGFYKDPGTQITKLRRVGFPIAVGMRSKRPTDTNLPAPVSGVNKQYPTFQDLVDDITKYTTLQANQIVDVSISKRCPYKVKKTAVSSGSDTLYAIQIYDHNDQARDPTLLSDGQTAVYFIGESTIESTNSTTVSVDMSDPVFRQCGSLQLRDWNENAIAELPILDGTVSVSFETHADESGIYTIMKCGDLQVSIPEGKLPYIENSWETYKAYQMEGDRQSMENAIRFAEYSRDTQRVVGTVNSAIAGATSGAMTGFMSGSAGAGAAALAAGGAIAGAITDLYAQDRAMSLERQRALADFQLTQKRAIDQPQSTYNVAYGLIYVTLNELNALRVCRVITYDVNEIYFSDWCAEFGYPSEGKREISVVDGYYLGKALSTSPDQSGMYWDRMNETLERGFKFVGLGLAPVLDAVLSGSGATEGYGGVTWRDRPNLSVNGDSYTPAFDDSPWGDSRIAFMNRDDLAKYVGFWWGQRTGSPTADQFGYCRYYYIAGRLWATNAFYGMSSYTEITNDTVIGNVMDTYNPHLVPANGELTDYMKTNAFNSLTIND